MITAAGRNERITGDPMKEVMVYYSNCNKVINEIMVKILAEKISDPWNHPLKGYFFKTIGQILEHIFVSDMIWTKSFLDVDSYGLSVVESVRNIPVYGDQLFNTIEEYSIEREKLDTFIIQYMSLLDESIFEKDINRKLNGQPLSKKVYKAMIHFFNHQTHHRGQISIILDEMNIENNFSNMIFLD